MYYQLILHRLCKSHGSTSLCYALVDKANELQGLEEFKIGLNADCRRKFKHPAGNLRAIELRDSKQEELLQLNDIVLGAICYQKNRRNEEIGMGQFKSNLAGYVLGRFGFTNYDFDSPPGSKISIWNFKSSHMKGVSR